MTDYNHKPEPKIQHADSVEIWLDEPNLDGQCSVDRNSVDANDDAKNSNDFDELTNTEFQQLLTHAMLAECFESPADREKRIEKTIRSLDSTDLIQTSTVSVSTKANHSLKAPGPKPNIPTRPTPKLWFAPWWSVAIATAASIAIITVIGLSLSPSQASAAMSRVIESCRASNTRIYDITIDRSGLLFRERRLDGTLHTRGTDRFVAKFPETPKGPTALGFDGEYRWWLQGDEQWNSGNGIETPRDAVISLLTSLQLQINSLLIELPEQYEIRLLEAEPLPGEPTVTCHPIEATRTGANRRLASTVRIWAHPVTGVVVQMELVHEKFKQVAASRVRLTLREEVNVPDSMFKANYHESETVK